MGLFDMFKKRPVLKENAPEIIPKPLPVGVRLTGFFMCRSGMCMEPMYILRETRGGVFMKITNVAPDELPDIDGSLDERERHWFNRVDSIFKEEYASSVKLSNDEPRQALEAAIEKAGALGWDGMRLRRELSPHVMDGDYGIELYLELSNGAAVEMRASNTSPDGWNDFYGTVIKIFTENGDFSHYIARDFDSAPCTYLSFYYKESGVLLSVSLSANSEIYTFDDKQGKLLGEPLDLSYRKDGDDPRPYDRFLNIFRKHNMERLNGYSGGGVFNSGFEARLSFEGKAEYTAGGSKLPEGFEDFLRDMAQEIHLVTRE